MTRDDALLNALRDGGVVYAMDVLADSRTVGLALTDCATLLTMESDGGHNVFGHDQTTGIPPAWMGHQVTEDRYVSLRHAVDVLGAGSQGVGPTQLTYRGFQLQADAQGGCWQPGPNRRVGFTILLGSIQVVGTYSAYGQYNGGPGWALKSDAVAYADKAKAVRAGWRDLIHDALAAAGY
jgi:hypothetical protein